MHPTQLHSCDVLEGISDHIIVILLLYFYN